CARIPLQLVRLLDDRPLEREQLGKLPGGRFPPRLGSAELAMLLQQGDSQTGQSRDLTVGGGHLAREQAEQGGFARSVAAHDTPPLPGADGEGDVSKQRRRAEFHAYAGEGDLCHTLIQDFQSCSARPTVRALPFRTSGIRSSSGSSASFSS